MKIACLYEKGHAGRACPFCALSVRQLLRTSFSMLYSHSWK